MKEQDRRNVLKGGLGIAAGALGVTAAVAPSAEAHGVTMLTLEGRSMRGRVRRATRTRLPRLDDDVTVQGLLVDGQGGRGTFAASGAALRLPDADEITLLEQHVFVMPAGTLTGLGQRNGPAGLFAVTGGTGTYAGASGSYTAQLNPTGFGGDGTARFEFSFTDRRQ